MGIGTYWGASGRALQAGAAKSKWADATALVSLQAEKVPPRQPAPAPHMGATRSINRRDPR